MFDPRMFAMNVLRQNPSIAQNQRNQDLLQVIRSGDNTRGQRIAENLCKTYGVTPQQAVDMATNFFRNQFHIPI